MACTPAPGDPGPSPCTTFSDLANPLGAARRRQSRDRLRRARRRRGGEDHLRSPRGVQPRWLRPGGGQARSCRRGFDGGAAQGRYALPADYTLSALPASSPERVLGVEVTDLALALDVTPEGSRRRARWGPTATPRRGRRALRGGVVSPRPRRGAEADPGPRSGGPIRAQPQPGPVRRGAGGSGAARSGRRPRSRGAEHARAAPTAAARELRGAPRDLRRERRGGTAHRDEAGGVDVLLVHDGGRAREAAHEPPHGGSGAGRRRRRGLDGVARGTGSRRWGGRARGRSPSRREGRHRPRDGRTSGNARGEKLGARSRPGPDFLQRI